MKLSTTIMLLFAVLIAMVGCQSGTAPLPTAVPQTDGGAAPDPAGPSEVIVVSRAPEQIATPLPGNANLAGAILSSSNNLPLIQLPIQLADVIRDGEGGNFILDTAHSHTTYTDVNGNFQFINIPAGEYVMVVGNAEVNRYEIVAKEDGLPRVFTAVADQLVNTDAIYVGLEWFSSDAVPAPSNGYPAPATSGAYP